MAKAVWPLTASAKTLSWILKAVIRAGQHAGKQAADGQLHSQNNEQRQGRFI